MRAPVPLDDDARVAALHRLGVLDQPPAADLDALTRLAAYVTGSPMSVLNLLDADRQWQAAATGMERGEVHRDDAMCAHTVAEDAFVHVVDASRDTRFADNAFVDGRIAEVRMYAAVPVHSADGHAVGSLCVVDPQVRALTAEQAAALRDLAVQAESLLEMRRRHVALLDLLAQVDHAARHDPLTGLANRHVLLDRLDHALSRSARSGIAPTLLFCDLDGFKAVNDTRGHAAGDEALVVIGRRLRSLVRPHDTVARLGGDEFVLLCEDLAPRDEAVVTTRLRQRVESCHGLSLSVGVHRPAPGVTAAEALDAADALMYADKRSRKQPVR